MKISKQGLLAGLALLGSTGAVSAQSTSVLPDFLQQMFDILGSNGYGAADKLTATITALLYIILGAIILVAVVYSILAGIKYIRSEGDPGKIEEAQKAIKAILMGVASIFVGILGIVLVYAVLGQTILKPSFQQVCLSAPNSIGCTRSSKQGADDLIVKYCVSVYSIASAKNVDGTAVYKDGLRPNIVNISKAAFLVSPETITVTTLDALVDINEMDTTGTLKAAVLADDNAAKLCLDPLNGGFYPTQTE